MFGPLNNRLHEYDISARNGFLPDQLPLQRLKDTYYERWELVVDNLAALLKSSRLRREIDVLPILSTDGLIEEREWQRAYLLLSFMAHAYIWGGQRPSEKLPAAICVPYIVVADHLGLPPTATYSALNLWNFTAIPDSDLRDVENLSILHTFTGTEDEAWFYLIFVAIEARGAQIILVMLAAMDAVRAKNSTKVTQSLLKFGDLVMGIASVLERMYERCDPDVFFLQIRPFLAVSKNMAIAGLPSGVFYDEGEGKGDWHTHSGGSNAQSSLIQFFDHVLGVKHAPTKNSKVVEVDVDAKHGFIEEMRKYMPAGHRTFLNHIESVANIREYVQTCVCADEVTAAYNFAVDKVAAFRNVHIQIVTRYIVLPSQKLRLSMNGGLNLAAASTAKKSGVSLSGTGGTDLMPFLKQSRDETKAQALEV